MTAAHSQTETLKIDINIPAHADRVTTPLFRKTRAALIEREHGRCWVCGRTAEESGHPLEAHHGIVERCLMNAVDWALFENQARNGDYGPRAQAFDWDNFDPAEPELFVDDMLAQGILLCKNHHVGKDEGVHQLPGPLFLPQRFIREGYKFSSAEVIHHAV